MVSEVGTVTSAGGLGDRPFLLSVRTRLTTSGRGMLHERMSG